MQLSDVTSRFPVAPEREKEQIKRTNPFSSRIFGQSTKLLLDNYAEKRLFHVACKNGALGDDLESLNEAYSGITSKVNCLLRHKELLLFKKSPLYKSLSHREKNQVRELIGCRTLSLETAKITAKCYPFSSSKVLEIYPYSYHFLKNTLSLEKRGGIKLCGMQNSFHIPFPMTITSNKELRKSHTLLFEFRYTAPQNSPPYFSFWIHNKGKGLSHFIHDDAGESKTSVEFRFHSKKQFNQVVRNSEFMEVLIMRKDISDIKSLYAFLANTFYTKDQTQIVEGIERHFDEKSHKRQLVGTCSESNATSVERHLADHKVRKLIKLFSIERNLLVARQRPSNPLLDRLIYQAEAKRSLLLEKLYPTKNS